MEIFKWLDDTSLVDSYTINDFRTSEDTFYINIRLIFTNSTEMTYREYFSKTDRKYSFHWQKKSGEMISRWDNAPHHTHISTFPHHRHLLDGTVQESHDISFQEIMAFIKVEINKKPKL